MHHLGCPQMPPTKSKEGSEEPREVQAEELGGGLRTHTYLSPGARRLHEMLERSVETVDREAKDARRAAAASDGGDPAPKRQRSSTAEGRAALASTKKKGPPTEEEVDHVVDRLFAEVEDRDAMTVGDINPSVASHYGLETLPKKVKRTDLITGNADASDTNDDAKQPSSETDAKPASKPLERESGSGTNGNEEEKEDEEDEQPPPQTVRELVKLLKEGAIDEDEFVRRYHKLKAEEAWRREYGLPPPTAGENYEDPHVRIEARYWLRENEHLLSVMELMGVSSDVWK